MKEFTKTWNITTLIRLCIAFILVIFGEYAPVGDTTSLIVMSVAYIVALAGNIALIVTSIKQKNVISSSFVVIMVSILLFVSEYMFVAIATLILYEIFAMCFQTIYAKKCVTNIELDDVISNEVSLYIEEEEMRISADEIVKGHIIKVAENEGIPADGVLFSEDAIIDETKFFGKHKVKKIKGDRIFAGSINAGKNIEIEVVTPRKASYIAKNVEKCNNSIAELYNKKTLLYKACLMIKIILFMVAIVYPIIMKMLGFGLSHILSKEIGILCAAISMDYLKYIVYISKAKAIKYMFENGIVVQNIEKLDSFMNVKAVLLDKSVNFVEDKYAVHHIRENQISKSELLTFVAHICYFQNDKKAQAIRRAFRELCEYEGVFAEKIYREDLLQDIDFDGENGLTGKVAGKFVTVGNLELMYKQNKRNLPIEEDYELLYVTIDNEYKGYIALQYLRDEESIEICQTWQSADIDKYAVLNEEGSLENMQLINSMKNDIDDEIVFIKDISQLDNEQENITKIYDDEEKAFFADTINMSINHLFRNNNDIQMEYDKTKNILSDIDCTNDDLQNVAIIKHIIKSVKHKNQIISICKMLMPPLYVIAGICNINILIPIIISGLLNIGGAIENAKPKTNEQLFSKKRK